jgi:hypothetical protein
LIACVVEKSRLICIGQVALLGIKMA